MIFVYILLAWIVVASPLFMGGAWQVAGLLWLNINALFVYWRYCRAVRKGELHG